MDAKSVLTIIEIIICVVLIISILLQQREGGMSTIFGGSGGGEGYRTKRGLELVLTRLTVVMIIALVVNTLLIAYINLQ